MNSSLSSRLRGRIDDAIVERNLGTGDKLPPERELALQLGVSRTTLRRALAGMERVGVVARRVGRRGGTFIADPAEVAGTVKIERSIAGSVPELLENQGFRARTRVISAALIEATTTHADHLDVAPAELLVEIRRVRLADGVPISFETMYLPDRVFPSLIERPLSGSLRRLVTEEYDVTIGKISESVEVVPASKSTAALLQIAGGDPLLAVTRISRDVDGRRVEYSIDYFRSDLTRLAIENGYDADPVGLRPAPRGAASPPVVTPSNPRVSARFQAPQPG